ncbi:MAG TPA: YceD family protein [Gammaproteobacteria bacterium]|nr:YceD family protein [Gammaproteobacteria bacterium]
MIAGQLPKYIQPMRMAEQGYILKGHLELSQFTRLADLLADIKGQVSVDLTCGQDQEGLRYIQGNLETTLHLECQRCLKSMDYFLQVAVSLSPVFNEAAGNNLPSRYEPLLLTEDKCELLTLIEDELLLALPLVPKHEPEQCNSL